MIMISIALNNKSSGGKLKQAQLGVPHSRIQADMEKVASMQAMLADKF